MMNSSCFCRLHRRVQVFDLLVLCRVFVTTMPFSGFGLKVGFRQGAWNQDVGWRGAGV